MVATRGCVVGFSVTSRLCRRQLLQYDKTVLELKQVEQDVLWLDAKTRYVARLLWLWWLLVAVLTAWVPSEKRLWSSTSKRCWKWRR